MSGLKEEEFVGDNEPFLIGGGYDNLTTHHLVTTKDYVSLEPYGIHAYMMMLVFNVLFVAFFAFVYYLAVLSENAVWILSVIVCLGLVTCALYDAVVFYRFRGALDRGVVLKYIRGSEVIELPAYDLEFSITDSIHIECITARQSSGDFGDRNSELNFVSTVGPEPKRWNLLRSIDNIRPFASMVSR